MRIKKCTKCTRGSRGSICITRAELGQGLRGGCTSLLQQHKKIIFVLGTIVSPAHSCSFPTASGHRQLNLLSKTSILNVFSSIEHMHFFFFFLNRIRLYESLKDRSYFLPKFAAVAQQELSCKACWERQQPKMQEGTGRGMGVIVLGGLAPDGLSIEQQACPRSPGNSRLAAVPRIWFDGRPRLWEAVSIASVSDGWVARNSRLPPPNSILLQTNTGFYWKETTKGEAVPQPPEEPESVTSKLAGLDLSLSAWCLCFSCSR